MEIPPAGLAATASAIQRQAARFEAAAQRTVGDASALSDPGPDAGQAGELSTDALSMQQETLINQMLNGVFRRQRDTEQSLLDLVRPADRG